MSGWVGGGLGEGEWRVDGGGVREGISTYTH